MQNLQNLVNDNTILHISGTSNNYKTVFLPNKTAYPQGDKTLNNDELNTLLKNVDGKIKLEAGEGINLTKLILDSKKEEEECNE